jgi:hypothetical protein
MAHKVDVRWGAGLASQEFLRCQLSVCDALL